MPRGVRIDAPIRTNQRRIVVKLFEENKGLFLYRTRHRRDVVLDEKCVEDDQR
jgi:hypothetical protein